MKNLAVKLLAFQKEVGAISKDSTNPFFHSAYFDINTLLAEVKPLLSKHNLVLLQPLVGGNLKTILIDADSGEELSNEATLPTNADPQKMGAIITYFRRYSLQSLLSLQAEDDDGNSVSNNKPVAKPVENKNDLPFISGVCPTCSSGLSPGKNGKPYCVPCYKKWASENKK